MTRRVALNWKRTHLRQTAGISVCMSKSGSMGAIATHIEQFLNYLVQERGLSPNTALSYKCDLDQFQLLVLQRGARNAEDLIEGHVLAWIAQLEESHAAENTIARKLTALHSFAKF